MLGFAYGIFMECHFLKQNEESLIKTRNVCEDTKKQCAKAILLEVVQIVF